jgi:hypothetical protein
MGDIVKQNVGESDFTNLSSEILMRPSPPSVILMASIAMPVILSDRKGDHHAHQRRTAF